MDIAASSPQRVEPVGLPAGSPHISECLEIQKYGSVRETSHGLSLEVKMYSCERLNQLLADTQILCALFMKHRWVLGDVVNYQLHLLLGKLASEQREIIEAIAGRIHGLGGVPVGDPRHIGEIAQIPRAPNGREDVPAMLLRLLRAIESILCDARLAATQFREFGDDATAGLMHSELIRADDIQARILREYLDKCGSHPCVT